MSTNGMGRWAVLCACFLTLAGFAVAQQDDPESREALREERRKERLERAEKTRPVPDKAARARTERESPPAEFVPANILRRADTNRDGVLTPQEYNAAMRTIFDEADRNGDGVLDRREMNMLLRAFAPPQQEADIRPPLGDRRPPFPEGRPPAAPEAQPAPESAWERLRRLDANRDGRITLDEWQGVPERFQRMDINQDGMITKEEVEQAARRLPPVAPGSRRPPAGAEPAGVSSNLEQRVEDFLERFDKDGDGKVSAEEFGGREAVFRRLDTNQDGFLTPDEIKAAPPRPGAESRTQPRP